MRIERDKWETLAKAGRKLQALRGTRALTLVAKAAGLSAVTLRQLEQGARVPRAQTLIALARYYGVDAEELGYGPLLSKAEDARTEKIRETAASRRGKGRPKGTWRAAEIPVLEGPAELIDVVGKRFWGIVGDMRRAVPYERLRATYALDEQTYRVYRKILTGGLSSGNTRPVSEGYLFQKAGGPVGHRLAVLAMWHDGQTIEEIMRRTGLQYNTIREYILEAEEQMSGEDEECE